jgi:hypothetical protein
MNVHTHCGLCASYLKPLDVQKKKNPTKTYALDRGLMDFSSGNIFFIVCTNINWSVNLITDKR